MPLLVHCLVNMSFGYLMLIAATRIVQEVMTLGSLISKRAKVAQTGTGYRS